MAEHWKSTPKYWCKHCSIYVKDTSFERKQHESTGKHQGNLKRSLQNIQKGHAKNEREKEKAKAEVDRLNRITGSASSTSTEPLNTHLQSKPKTSASTNLSQADQKRQWTQLAEMGIVVPEHARAEMAMAGDWQTVSKKVEADSTEEFDEKLNVGVKKRKFEGDDDEELNEIALTSQRKGWGSATKSYPVHSENTTQDLDTLLATSLLRKSSKLPKRETEAEDRNDHDTVTLSSPSAALQDNTDAIETTQHRNDTFMLPIAVKKEAEPENAANASTESCNEPALPLFKKRKPKAHSANSDS